MVHAVWFQKVIREQCKRPYKLINYRCGSERKHGLP